MLSIAQTEEWRSVIAQMRQELDRLHNNVVLAVGSGSNADKAFGLYDGYRQAIEKLEALGGES
jgi:tryptophan synthase beta subunit